jgi:hypothetical protein
MITIDREPTTPGEILYEEFLKPLNRTQKQLSDPPRCGVLVKVGPTPPEPCQSYV